MSELINQLVEKRELSPDYIVKIGIDGGGGFLKVCLSILDCEVNEPKTKFWYREGIKQDKFKDRGVKKLIILAIVEDENHQNIKHIIELLGISTKKYFLAFDLKLANIYFGIEAASSTHPCSWCELSKQDMQDFTICACIRYLGISLAL